MIHLLMALSIAVAPVEVEPLAPGDGLSLARNPLTRSHTGGVLPRSVPSPVLPGSAAGGVVALVAALTPAISRGVRRRRARRSDSEPFFIYVPGHGGSPSGFDDLAGRMGLDSERIRVFDYRWAHADRSAEAASRQAPTARAADALDFYLREQAKLHSQIYLVGHSKGGAVITELVSRWDADPSRTVQAVTGAPSLDPPIAAGEPWGRFWCRGRRSAEPDRRCHQLP